MSATPVPTTEAPEAPADAGAHRPPGAGGQAPHAPGRLTPRDFEACTGEPAAADSSSAAPADFSHARRVDLHCHSIASTEADEAVLNAMRCPECFSEPEQVYAQAKRRGMQFVTITDHDCIDGVLPLAGQPDVIVGEELTCYFPEDRCKMHVLVWGIDRTAHDALQARADDLYAVAAYIEEQQIAHAVAHALYRQNDRLERWHLERLILMFKGFEALNGAHSLLHRTALEPVLDGLTPGRIAGLAEKHGMAPRWPEPWHKARTGGSDDHGLFNIGRTWTEFPADVRTPADVLRCLREGRCRPGGECGSSLKLAHNFYGVGIRHYTRNINPAAGRTVPGALLEMLVGDRRRLRRRDVVKTVLAGAVKGSVAAVGRGIMRPFRGRRRGVAAAGATSVPGQFRGAAGGGKAGSVLLADLFTRSFRNRTAECGPLADALRRGEAPLGEHEAMFRLVSAINRDVTGGILQTVAAGLGRGELAPLFDALSAVAGQQFVMLPYYFALFHQNRERCLVHRVTGLGGEVSADQLRVGLFTDTLDEVNGVGRFLAGVATQATARGRSFTLHTCAAAPRVDLPARKNFDPVATFPMPFYAGLPLALPPVAEVMECADRQQFDAIHVSTPGPMGLCGLLVAKMLRVPLVATYHTDFPAFVRDLTGDHRLTGATAGYVGWFYRQAAAVFARSRAYEQPIRDLGVPADRISVLHPSVDAATFNPRRRDDDLWRRFGVRQPYRLLYAGRVSAEKNLAMLADAFRRLCGRRCDVALVVAGDGPFRADMRKRLNGLPAHFVGCQDDAGLSALYASSDLFVFPSRTDTLGQAVVEAQACGLPVLVGDEGGPCEFMDDGITGVVLPARDGGAWADAVDGLLDDAPRRSRMARTAPQRLAQRLARANRADTFDQFWDAHVAAVLADRAAEDAGAVTEPPARTATATGSPSPDAIAETV